MGLNLELPHQIVVHGHWLKDDRKMSKSVGKELLFFFAKNSHLFN
jgi:methionyl-tRNA synthetase